MPEVLAERAPESGLCALIALVRGLGIQVGMRRIRELAAHYQGRDELELLTRLGAELGVGLEPAVVSTRALGSGLGESALLEGRDESGAPRFFLVARSGDAEWRVLDPQVGRLQMTTEELVRHVAPSPMRTDRERAELVFETLSGGWSAFEARLRELGVSESVSQRAIERAEAEGIEGRLELDGYLRLCETLERDGRSAGLSFELPLLDGISSEDVPRSFRLGEVVTWGEQASVELDAVRVLQLTGVGSSIASTRTKSAPGGEPGADEMSGAAPDSKRTSLGRILASAIGARNITLIVVSILISSAVAAVEVLLLKVLMALLSELSLDAQRVFTLALVAWFVATSASLNSATSGAVSRASRSMEASLRSRVHAKIAQLGERFHSHHPASELATKSLSLGNLWIGPQNFQVFLSAVSRMVVVSAGLVILDRDLLVPVFVAVVLSALLSTVGLGLGAQIQAGLETWQNVADRKLLDALRSAVPIRTHGAEASVEARHAEILTRRIVREEHKAAVGTWIVALHNTLGRGAGVWIVATFVWGGGTSSSVLLVAYWAAELVALGGQAAETALSLPFAVSIIEAQRQVLEAPDEIASVEQRAAWRALMVSRETSVEIAFHTVGLSVAGQNILQGVDLRIRAGEHVAVVGRSGSGKSSLVGMLLGDRRPTTGSIRVGGEALDERTLEQLRSATAWVAPEVHLWNASLAENLAYGNDRESGSDPTLGAQLRGARLQEVARNLPHGSSTPLGEGGALVSGGEGQRVRLGRGLGRQGTRLVILDEAFRGLDEGARLELLREARAHWGRQTLLCVTHDIRSALEFPRIVVMDAGRVVEDGRPEELLASPASHLSTMLTAQNDARRNLWGLTTWRRWSVVAGSLHDFGCDLSVRSRPHREHGEDSRCMMA